MNHAVNWEAISAIGQLVGALAVVISLIYLAREVGSNAHATRRATMRSMLDSLNQFAQQITGHADLAELRSRGFRDYESLEGVDRSRFETYMHALFRTVEDVYYQHLEGHVDPRRWRGLEAVMRDMNTYPGVQAWWRSHSHWFGGEEFAKFINQQQQTAKPPRMFGEANPDQ
jgi:hypothetical protein